MRPKLQILSLFIGALALIFAGVGVQTAYAAPTDLFISEYIEGSSNNKALEIFNGTGAAVDLGAGQYLIERYNNGSSSVTESLALTGIINDGDVLVIYNPSAVAAITSVGDISSSITFYNGDDAIVLRKGGASGPVLDSIGQVGVDPGTNWIVGTGATSEFTLVRQLRVCAGDTNPNDTYVAPDWDVYPQNTFSFLGSHTISCTPVDTPPTVTATAPNNGAINVPVGSNIAITFNEPVNVTAGLVTLTCSSGTPVAIPFTITTVMPASIITFDPTSNFPSTASPVTTCTMTLPAASVADADGTVDNMVSPVTFSFDIEVPALPGANRIRDIQGAGHVSSLLNTTVTNVPGIVTALSTDGFWFQDPQPDADNATSEGIFVFTTTNPTASPYNLALGNAVLVSGIVRERFGQTQINGTNAGTTPPNSTPVPAGPASPALSVVSWTCTGDCTIDTILVGDGNTTAQTACGVTNPTYIRQRPFTTIEDDNFANFDITTDGMDFWESLEGMRVCMHDSIVLSIVTNFDEFWVTPDNGAGATLLNSRSGLTISAGDLNPEIIQIDDTLFNNIGGQPIDASQYPTDANIEVGARITGAMNGVIGYSFDTYELLPNQAFTYVNSTLTRETTTLVGNGTTDFTFATYNVENLGGSAPTAEFDDRADQICNNLQQPDIVMLQEIQDNNGATNDAVVDSATTLTNLVNAISTECGITYSYAFINPTDDQDGGAPGGNIRVAFIYRTDRPISLATGATGGSNDNTTVTCTAGVPTLNYTLGRIDPTNSAFNSSRKPLVGQFNVNGIPFFLINLHMNSKGGDGPLWGFTQPPFLASEVQRLQQATIINAFIQQIEACDPYANIIVAGDYNDFQFSPPVATLIGGTSLTVMNTTLPAAERYSYYFNGNAQSLDHIGVSGNLFNNASPVYDTVHINAGMSDQVSDHDPSLIRIQLPYTLDESATAETSLLTSTNPASPVLINVATNVDNIVVTFTTDVKYGTPTNADHADSPDNYIVLAEGSVAGFQTTGINACVTGVNVVADVEIIPTTVTYTNGTRTTTLTLSAPLVVGKYSLIICGSTSIVDTFGRALNNGQDVQYYFDITTTTNNGGGNNGGGNTNTGGTTTTVLTQQQIESGAVQSLPATGETLVWADTLRNGLVIGIIALITLGLGFIILRRRTAR